MESHIGNSMEELVLELKKKKKVGEKQESDFFHMQSNLF